MDTFNRDSYLTIRRLPTVELPFISKEDMANVRNDSKHRATCQKNRMKRKKRNRK